MFMMCDLSESPGVGGSCQPRGPAQPSPCAVHLARVVPSRAPRSAGSWLGSAPSVTQKPLKQCEKSTVTSAVLLPCHLWRDSFPKCPPKGQQESCALHKGAHQLLLLWPWQHPFGVTALGSQCGNPSVEFIFLIVGKL